MKISWHIPNNSNKPIFKSLILAGDIGGTNTNLALVGFTESTDPIRFNIIADVEIPSRTITNFTKTILEFVTATKKDEPEITISCAAVSGAGPVKDNFCTVSNLNWNIDGPDIEKALSIPVLVINDFLAISYGIPLLDTDDENKIKKIPRPDGTFSTEHGNVKAVVGAGTGLGVGYLVKEGGFFKAYPSEGGHIDFASVDQETADLKQWLTEKYGQIPGTETALSGQGISNIFQFLMENRKYERSDLVDEILTHPRTDYPGLIAANVDNNKLCKDTMMMFLKIYGNFAGTIALTYYATGGVYLAGGIASKNIGLFTQTSIFMKNFERNYKSNIGALLQTIPIYIILDYSISLLGAANAGYTLILREQK